jgi:ATP-binding cassette subfamily B (MDR/TAP) protein 1
MAQGLSLMAISEWEGTFGVIGFSGLSELTKMGLSHSFYTVFVSVIFGAMHAGTMLIYAGDITKAKSSAVAMSELIDRAERQPKRTTYPITKPIEGSIIFRNVDFSYPSRPYQTILSQMNFSIQPGQSVAFVGESGSGKSTLASLLYRFYDPTRGAIFLDGRDIATYNVDEFRSRMAIVQQEPMLYDGTIQFNIELGVDRDVSREEVETACKEAGIWSFIQSLPQGLETDLGGKGVALSGGQRQRIAIARALIRKPSILVSRFPIPLALCDY